MSSRGTYPRRRGAQEFSDLDRMAIETYQWSDMETLYRLLTSSQNYPRTQRLIQEAIERKRANGNSGS